MIEFVRMAFDESLATFVEDILFIHEKGLTGFIEFLSRSTLATPFITFAFTSTGLIYIYTLKMIFSPLREYLDDKYYSGKWIDKLIFQFVGSIALIALLILMYVYVCGVIHIYRLEFEFPGRVLAEIDRTLNDWRYAILFCLLGGIVAYFIRCNHRILYGFAELAVGAYASLLSSNFSDRLGGLQFAAGLYIIVRALDNIERGLDESKDLYPTIHMIWNYLFREAYKRFR